LRCFQGNAKHSGSDLVAFLCRPARSDFSLSWQKFNLPLWDSKFGYQALTFFFILSGFILT
jgi:hypothetical protein